MGDVMVYVPAVLLGLFYLALVVIAVLKGRGICLLGSLVWAAFGLAEPGSWWDRHVYDEVKSGYAHARRARDLAAVVDVRAERNDEINAAWADEDVDPDELDPITRRALKKAGRI